LFKSVFKKYIFVFMLIIIVSFIILTFVITTLVDNYSANLKIDTLSEVAFAYASKLTEDYDRETNITYSKFVLDNYESLSEMYSLLSVNTDKLIVLLTDAGGNVIYSLGYSDNALSNEISSVADKIVLPDSVIDEIWDGKQHSYLSDLGGFFKAQHAAYEIPVKTRDGQLVGSVFAVSSDLSMGTLLGDMIKTVILSSLWIMLASMVAIYFISERMISPLKAMSRAAKKFAAGNFDARVPVTGNDEVAELAEAFNNMAASLSTLEDMRRTFLANVSHDLRTPMTTIAGFIDGILDGAIPPEKQNYYLGVIGQEVRRLSRLVNSLLDISRMEAGERKFNMTSFDVCELARCILISFEQRIDQKRLDVAFECDDDNMYVYADKDSIHQILYNICENGLKFSRESGKYQIHIHRVEGKIRVSVFNEGVGIPEGDLPYVFDRFYKTDKSRGLDKTGVGLGLYICRTIIEAHKEKIWVESVSGEWCRFTFTLTETKAQKAPEA